MNQFLFSLRKLRVKVLTINQFCLDQLSYKFPKNTKLMSFHTKLKSFPIENLKFKWKFSQHLILDPTSSKFVSGPNEPFEISLGVFSLSLFL